MFLWGVIGSVLTISSILLGLKWGALGVAASYSLTYVIVITPLLSWYVSRTGLIKMADFYRTVSPIAAASIVSLVAL